MLLAFAASWSIGSAPPTGDAATIPVRVSSVAELRNALADPRPGLHIVIAAGSYSGFGAANVHGAADRPIVVRAADPVSPPTFVGGVHFSDVSYVEIAHITIAGAPSPRPNHNWVWSCRPTAASPW